MHINMLSIKLHTFCWGFNMLTHWGRMTHKCVDKLTIIGSDNGLSPWWRQAIIWTNAGILLIWPLATNFNEILIGIHTFSFKKMHLKMSSVEWRPFCLGLNVLKLLHGLEIKSAGPFQMLEISAKSELSTFSLWIKMYCRCKVHFTDDFALGIQNL